LSIEKTFGETVKKLRKEAGLPLREVAKALQIDTSMLGKIEKNNRKPTKALIQKFSTFFKVSHKELTIAFLSDTVAYEVLDETDYINEVLLAAEQKARYRRTKKKASRE
jgi:HTH-type transcriptional regulator, competence development regulator